MRKMIPIPILALSFLCIAASGSAEDRMAVPAEIDAAARVKYDQNPDLPSGIAFVETMHLVNGMRSDDPEVAIAFIGSEMGLDRSDSESFIESLRGALRNFFIAELESNRNVACENGVPRTLGDSAFDLLSAMDDARHELAAAHLSEFSGNLDRGTRSRFQQMLELRKLDIVHVTIDHRKMANDAGVTNIDSEIGRFCIELPEDVLKEYLDANF